MTLDDVRSQLQAAADQGDLTLGSLTSAVSSFGAIFGLLPIDGPVPLSGATFSVTGSGADEVLTVTADADWGVLSSLASTFTVTADSSLEGAYLASAAFALPSTADLKIPGVSWFEFDDFTLGGSSVPAAIAAASLLPPAVISLTTTLVINGDSSQTKIPIAISVSPGGLLGLSLDTEAIVLPSINDILAAFGATASGISLPDTLNSLLNFSLELLSVAFDPVAGTVASIGVQIGNAAGADPWPIIPGYVAVESYAIGLNVSDPLGQAAVSGMVSTVVVLGSVDISVAAAHPATGGWQFQGAIGGDDPVPISTLLAGVTDTFKVDLPDVLQHCTLKSFLFGFDTSSSDVSGEFTLDFVVDDEPIELWVSAALTHSGTAYDVAVAGRLTIGAAEFDVTFTDRPGDTSFTAKWSDPAHPLEFGSIASAFGWQAPVMPEGLDLGLTDVEFTYNSAGGTIALRAHSVHYGQLVFATLVTSASSPTPNERVYVMAIDIPVDLELSRLPLVGPQVPADLDFGIEQIGAIVASSAIAAPDLTALNTLITGVLGGEPLAPTTLTAGVTLVSEVQIGGTTSPVILPLTSSSTTPSVGGGDSGSSEGVGAAVEPPDVTGDASIVAAADAPAPAPTYDGGATWITVGATLGPVTVSRVGVEYQDGELGILFDAGVSVAGLQLSCQGLGVSSPLTNFDPSFHLSGAAVGFSSGPVTIDGGLLVVPPAQLPPGVTAEYLGDVTIAIEPWVIAGLASYAKVDGDTSFFVFAQVDGDFGGPPAFFITGFMGGFGYNSQLTLPAPDRVSQFPFVAGLDDPNVFGPNPTPMSVLTTLAGTPDSPAVVTPMVGETWIAAGIVFRSYELVLGHALVVVEFGKSFEIALLGLASASLPQGDAAEAYAFIELQLEAVFEPTAGYLGITASLTPTSFLFTKACHLTGGFAFCLWYGPNEHAGDFVLTVGGYHPAFTPPAWYPAVSPVGFNWQVDSAVTIKGGAYFALTPSAIMAGGNLEVLYQSGDVKAWFIAYANLLITWKPFHFNASIGISLGASVRVKIIFTTVTLSLELGATLDLWGPPTGGVVHVHLYIVSFSVSFGASTDSTPDAELTWSDFSTLLPQSSTSPNASAASPVGLSPVDLSATADPTPRVLGLQANTGLVRQDGDGVWYVRSDEFSFTSTTAVPATSISFSGQAPPPVAQGATPVTPPASIAIRPMGVASATSDHAVTLEFVDTKQTIGFDTWTQVPQTGNLPAALWGAPLPPKTTPPPTSDTVAGLPTGVRLIAPPATVGDSPGAITLDELVEPVGGGYAPLTPASQVDPLPVPQPDPTSIATISATIGSGAAEAAQQSLLASLAALDATPPTTALLTGLGAIADVAFVQPPMSIS